VIVTLVHKAVAADVPVRFTSPLGLSPEPTTADNIDLYAVERVLSGEHPTVKLTVAEAHLAWSLIKDPEKELSAAVLAGILGVTSRTIVRWRMGHTRSGS